MRKRLRPSWRYALYSMASQKARKNETDRDFEALPNALAETRNLIAGRTYLFLNRASCVHASAGRSY